MGVNVTVTGRSNLGKPVFAGADFTVACWLLPIGQSTVSQKQVGCIGKWNTGGVPGTNEWLLVLNPSGAAGSEQCGFGIEQGSTISSAYDAIPWISLVPLFMVGVKQGTTLTLYRADDTNYRGVTATATCSAGAINNVSARNLVLGEIDIDPQYNTCAAYWSFASWNRALSAQEVKEYFRQTRYGGLPAFVQRPADAALLSIPVPTYLDTDGPFHALPTLHKKSLRGGYKIARNHPQAQGLLAHYQFTENTGTVTRDIARSGTGAISGSTSWAYTN